MRFSEVGAVRWNHDSNDPIEKQPIEVEVVIDKKPKKFRRQAGDPLMKLVDRIKLCMVNKPNLQNNVKVVPNKKAKVENQQKKQQQQQPELKNEAPTPTPA